MKPYQDKKWLENKYLAEGLGIYQIAPLCQCHPRTIHQWLIRFEIPRRKPGWKKMPEDQKELRRQWSRDHPDHKPTLGKKATQETKDKMSARRKGAGGSNWKGGLTLSVRLFRKSRQYQEWRKAVLERDGGKCQETGCGKETTIVHHIMTVKDYPYLRLEITNGIALCALHHKRKHIRGKKDE